MSWQARAWVIERSTHRGVTLFCLYMIADELNAQGVGSYASVTHLGRLMRMMRPAVQRILRRLEKSEELVCVKRGTGRENTVWRIPGVVLDGYDKSVRGNPRLPQGQPSVAPEATHGSARGNGGLPNQSTGGGARPVPHKTTIPPPPSVSSAAAGDNGHAAENTPEDFIKVMASGENPMDVVGATRLWSACRKAAPWADLDTIIRAVEYKDRRLKGAKNPTGVLIAVVPRILQAWGPVGRP